MAKKIIKAQMKQRTDTKANWASSNPVLLKGELGLVDDDPNLYKVGDGATAWNALPFRGFNGTVVNETGTSETVVMSQKAVTEELTKLVGQSLSWKLGSLDYSTGESRDSTTRVRNLGYIKTSTVSKIKVAKGFKVSRRYYYNEAIYNDDIQFAYGDQVWHEGTVDIDNSVPYLRLVAAYTDNRDINDLADITEAVTLAGSLGNVEVEISSISSALEGKVVTLELGSIKLEDGVDAASDTRARSGALSTDNPIAIPIGTKIAGRYYDATGKFVASDNEWTFGSRYVPKTTYPYIRILVAYTDDRAISNVEEIQPKALGLEERVYELETKEVSAQKTASFKVMQFSAENNGIVKTLSLKAVKQSNAVRGRCPIPVAWLYMDNDTGKMYLAKGRPDASLVEIATWDKSKTWNGQCDAEWYTILITPEDDLICVFRSEMLNNGVVGRDSDRKNPIVYLHDDYANPIVVDFGSDPAPSAWLMSSGADYDYVNDFMCFSEYGRVNLSYSNVWKVSKPYADKNSWSIKKSHKTSGDPTYGFKHHHCCEIDPFTGIVYAATGDDDTAAAIYASQDNGETYNLVVGPNEMKCRLLNFIFTEDYIWWASDSHAKRHALFRASRTADGVLSESTIELVTQIPYNSDAYFQATYITYYDARTQCLLFLDRYDSPYAVPMQLYGYDIKKGELFKTFLMKSVTGDAIHIGFRCECSSFYNGLANNGITLGWQWAANTNLVLNNTTENQLGNVEIIVA